MSEPELSDPARLEALRRSVAALEGGPCVACGRALCGHEAVTCVVMGLGTAQRCLSCLAIGLGRPVEELRAGVHEHVSHRECFGRVWREADGRERDVAHCPWAAVQAGRSEAPRVLAAAAADDDAPAAADASWDAGDTGCGELVLELRRRLARLAPGQVLAVTATDLGAPQDLPAWCGLTGNTLVTNRHPNYLIRRKKER